MKRHISDSGDSGYTTYLLIGAVITVLLLSFLLVSVTKGVPGVNETHVEVSFPLRSASSWGVPMERYPFFDGPASVNFHSSRFELKSNPFSWTRSDGNMEVTVINTKTGEVVDEDVKKVEYSDPNTAVFEFGPLEPGTELEIQCVIVLEEIDRELEYTDYHDPLIFTVPEPKEV